MARFLDVIWVFFILINAVLALTPSHSATTTSCKYTNVIEQFYQSPPISTAYLTTITVKSIIGCQDRGCVTNTVHVNEAVASIYFTSATTVSASTELYYECTPTSSAKKHDSGSEHHGLKDRNYMSTLSDVYENNRGYHRFVSSQSGSLITADSAFTTLSSSGPVTTSSLSLTFLPSIESSNTLSSTLQTSSSSPTCTSVVGTPSPAFIMNSAPGYTFRYACGTTVEDVEACPYLCGDFSPKICNAVDMSNVKDAGTCTQCPLPCPGGSTKGPTLSPPSNFAGTTFAGPTLSNMTSVPSSTLGAARASCTSVPANATSSAPVVLEQQTWRIACGQTMEDVVACPFLCGYFSGCDGTPNCGRACSGTDLSAQDGEPCEHCLLPCNEESTSAPVITSTPFPSVFPGMNLFTPTFIASGPSTKTPPTPTASSTSVTAAPTTAAPTTISPPAFVSCLPVFGGLSNPDCQPTCNNAAPSASAALVIPGLVAGCHFRVQCGTTEEDVAQCPWLCGNLCAKDDLSKWGGGPCKKCLPPCSTLSLGPLSTSTSIIATGTGLQISTVAASNTTRACTTIPTTAMPSPAIYDGFPGVDLFVRDGNCGTNYLEVLECPYICGSNVSSGGVGGCSPRNITADEVNEGAVDPTPCQQCLPPCSKQIPAFLPSAAQGISNTPCVDLPPAIDYVPTFVDPSLNESLRQFCGITPETSEGCPWLCGYFSNPELGSITVPQLSNPLNMATLKLCSLTNLTASFADPVLGPLPCEQCPLVCSPRESNPFPNVAPNTTLPVNISMDQVPRAPSFPSTCNPIQPSPSSIVFDPAVNVGYRHNCGTTTEEVEECAFLCGYTSSYLRVCSPSNLTEYLAPWWTPPCEQCLRPCGTNNTANFTTAVPTVSPSASAPIATVSTTIPLVKRQLGRPSPHVAPCECKNSPNACDCVVEKRGNSLIGREAALSPHTGRSTGVAESDPILARAVCPSPPNSHCPYVCAKEAQDDYHFRCSYGVPSNSSISCIQCLDPIRNPTSRLHSRQADPLALLPPFTGIAMEQGIQIATALFIYQFYNSGVNLTTACQELDVVKIFTMGLNGTTVKQFICDFAANATAPPYTSYEENIGIAAAILALSVAGGFAGGCNLTVMCNDIDFQLVTDLGFDGQGIKNFVCGVASGTSLAPTSTATSVPLGSTSVPTTINTSTRSRSTSYSKGWN